jgi:hypothetical protein
MRPWLDLMGLLPLLASAPLASCGDPADPPTTGTLEVTTSTVGGPESLSYALRLDGALVATLGGNASATIAGLPTGFHAIALLELPRRCTSAGGSARSIEIASATTTQVHFDVTCAAAGSLRVITSVTGDSLDPDGFIVAVAGRSKLVGGAADTLVFEGLDPGPVLVSVAGLAANCAVSDAPVVTALVPAGAETTVGIAIQCHPAATDGVIQVSVSSSLINAPIRSYSVVLDRVRTLTVPAMGSASFIGVPAGAHSLRLNVPPYCSVGGFVDAPNPVIVVLPPNGAVTVRFSVLCIG